MEIAILNRDNYEKIYKEYKVNYENGNSLNE